MNAGKHRPGSRLNFSPSYLTASYTPLPRRRPLSRRSLAARVPPLPGRWACDLVLLVESKSVNKGGGSVGSRGLVPFRYAATDRA